MNNKDQQPIELAGIRTLDIPAQRESQKVLDTFFEMVCELWDYRELLLQLTLRNIRIRYKQAIMGCGWALLMPALIVTAGLLIKYAMANMSGSGLQAGSFAGMAVKALPWAFFVGAVGFATNSLTSETSLITKIYFAREVLPLSAVLAQAFDTVIGSAVLLFLLGIFLGVEFSVQFLWVIPVAGSLFLFTVGMGLFLSCGNLFFRDVKYVVQILLTFGIFFTPVFYEPVDLGSKGWLIMLNPLAPLLEGLRLAVVEHHNLADVLLLTSRTNQEVLAWHPAYLFYAIAWALLGCLGAWFIFHKLEFTYAEYI